MNRVIDQLKFVSSTFALFLSEVAPLLGVTRYQLTQILLGSVPDEIPDRLDRLYRIAERVKHRALERPDVALRRAHPEVPTLYDQLASGVEPTSEFLDWLKKCDVNESIARRAPKGTMYRSFRDAIDDCSTPADFYTGSTHEQ